MKQHFKSDAERVAALKRSRWLVTGILILIAISIAFLVYKIFIK
jgi:hypothetical protein